MSATNYIRAGMHVFTFDDRSEESTRAAYHLAVMRANHARELVMFRVPRVAGPWDQCGLVFHRRRDLILSAIRREEEILEFGSPHAKRTAQERRFLAQAELHALEKCWEAVGRKHTDWATKATPYARTQSIAVAS